MLVFVFNCNRRITNVSVMMMMMNHTPMPNKPEDWLVGDWLIKLARLDNSSARLWFQAAQLPAVNLVGILHNFTTLKHTPLIEWYLMFCRYLWLSCTGIYGGFLLGVRSVSGLAFYDWESSSLVRRIEITPKMVRTAVLGWCERLSRWYCDIVWDICFGPTLVS